MKNIIALFVIALFLGRVVKPQANEKITEVFYSETETIESFKESESFIGVTTYESIGYEQRYYANILDKSGKTKFKIASKTGYIFQTRPLEKIGNFLVIENNSEAKLFITSYN